MMPYKFMARMYHEADKSVADAATALYRLSEDAV